MLRLPELQREFFHALAIQNGAAAGTLVADIRGDDRLDAFGRLDVYVGMYATRLADVLREDYPRVLAALGADAFGAVARDYILAHPSTHPSLRWFGRGFTDFVGGETTHVVPEFLPDLARLEWARLSVFDAPDVALLDVEALRRLAPESWGTLRLRLSPAVELLDVDWPVHRIWENVEADASSMTWSREPTHLRVWRQDDKVYQAAMDEVERTALLHVRAGDDFAELCNGLTAVVAPETAAQTAGALVLRWIADGLLRGLDPER